MKIIKKKEYDAKRAQERKIITPIDLSKMNLKELQAKATSLNIELEHEQSGKGRGRGAKKIKTIKQLIAEIKKVEASREKKKIKNKPEEIIVYSK